MHRRPLYLPWKRFLESQSHAAAISDEARHLVACCCSVKLTEAAAKAKRLVLVHPNLGLLSLVGLEEEDRCLARVAIDPWIVIGCLEAWVGGRRALFRRRGGLGRGCVEKACMVGRLDRLMDGRDSCLRSGGRHSLLVCRHEVGARGSDEDDHDGHSDEVGSHLLVADDLLLCVAEGFALFPICLVVVVLLPLEMLLLCPCSSSSPSFLCSADRRDYPILVPLRLVRAYGPNLMLLLGCPSQR